MPDASTQDGGWFDGYGTPMNGDGIAALDIQAHWRYIVDKTALGRAAASLKI